MSSDHEKKITLVSSDSETFKVDVAVAELSQTIKNLIEDGVTGAIPLPNVTSETLARVIEYSKRHVVAYDEVERRVWEAEFDEKLELGAVLELLLAASYFNHKSLMEFSSQCAADKIKDKSVEEVRKIFNITSDYTPEEEEELRKEAPWAHATP